MTIEEMLDQLAEFQAAKDKLMLDQQELIDQVITAEIKAKIAEIRAEFAPAYDEADRHITALEADVRAAVLEGGKTVKGSHLQAVYCKPRVSWDTSKLDGLMIVIPQLKEARKEGAPSVTLRKV